MRGTGIDYFENSRRATLSQRAYAIANPGGFAGLRPGRLGPHRLRRPARRDAGRSAAARDKFQTYAARGASIAYVLDDGTIAPTAAAGSIAFAPEIVVPALREMRAALRGSDVCERIRLHRRVQSHARRRVRRAALRAHRAGRGLVRHGPARHRPGPDRRHDRELPQRPRLEDHARESRTSCAGLKRAGFTGGWLDAPRALTRLAARAGARRCSPAALRRCRAERERSVLRFWGMGREGEVVRELVPEFERENPDIRVDVQQIPWTAAHEKLLTALRRRLAAGPRAARQHLDPGVRRARRARAARRARRGVARRSSPGDYFPGIWDTNVFDGATYGIPWYVDTRVLFYRKDLLQRPAGDSSRRDLGGVARGDARRSSGALGPGRFAIFLPINEWTQPTSSACRSARRCWRDGGTRGAFAQPAFRPRVRLLRRPVQGRGSRRVVSYTRSRTSTRSSRGLRRHVDHRARGTSASSAAACPPDCRTRGRRRRCPARRRGNGRAYSIAGGSSSCSSGASQHKDAAWKLDRVPVAPGIADARSTRSSGDLPARREAWDDPSLADDAKARAFREQLERVRPAAAACPSGSRSRTIAEDQPRRAIRGRGHPRSALAVARPRRGPHPREAPLAPGAGAPAAAPWPLTRPRREAAGARGLAVPGARRSAAIASLFAPPDRSRRSCSRSPTSTSTRIGDLAHARFVGLRNYARLLADPAVLEGGAQHALLRPRRRPADARRRSLGGRAARQREAWRAGAALFRTVFFTPVVTTLVAVAIVWRYLYHPRYGLINHALGWVGIPPIDWLGDPRWAMPAIILLAVWKNFGYDDAPLRRRACRRSPSSCTRRRALDGAAPWQTFRSITLPLLAPTLALRRRDDDDRLLPVLRRALRHDAAAGR